MTEPSLLWTFEARWPSEVRHVADARHFVSGHLRRNGLTSHADTIALVVSELATNAVLHAETPFTVTLERDEGAITVAVSDRSTVQLVRPGRQDSPTSRHGWGLHIVQTLSTAWGVAAQRDGKSVWASFRLSIAEPAVAGQMRHHGLEV
jgi:anti-sigma regulatory factor (Ser/Thr protein kinase)